MSKTTVRRLLSSLSREQLVEVVMELYDARKEAHDYLEYYANPDEEKLLEKSKTLIDKEFMTKSRGRAKVRSSVCRKVIKEFDTLQPSAANRAELRVHLLERLVGYARSEYWWLRTSHVSLLTWLMSDTLRLLHDSGLDDGFRRRIVAQAELFDRPRNPRRTLLLDEIRRSDEELKADAAVSDNILPLW